MKKNRTFNYLTSKHPLDGFERVRYPFDQDPTFVPRLSFKPSQGGIDLEDMSSGLAQSPEDIAIFLDNNIWVESLGKHLWPALLQRPRGVYVTPGVRRELEPWRTLHPEFIGCKAVQDHQAPLELLDVPSDEVERRALLHYTTLLFQRRNAFIYFRANFEMLHDRAPTDAEMMEGVQKQFGQRALLMVHKNGQRVQPDEWATDEQLVCAAAAHGLATGEPTIVLTQDQDVFEQFYKLWWLLDTHYRAMLLADLYANDPLNVRHQPLPKTVVTESQFEMRDDEFLLDFGSRRMRACLPDSMTFVSQECWLLRPGGLTRLTFGAEREMYRLWNMKGTTPGLVSDRLGGRNLHSYLGATLLGGSNPYVVANCAAVVHDKGLPTPETGLIPSIDISYSLFSNEHFTRIEQADPQSVGLWTPGGV